MIKNHPFWCLLVLLSFVGCNAGPRQHDRSNTAITEQDTIAAVPAFESTNTLQGNIQPDKASDTLLIEQERVVFFMPNQSEYDSMMVAAGDEAQDLVEGYSDFVYYAEAVSKQMHEKGIPSVVTAHKVFKVVTGEGIIYYNRQKTAGTDTGIIIFDGKTAPVIQTGVMSEIDFLSLIGQKIR